MKFRLLKPLTILSTLLIILLCFTASASAFFVSSEKIHVGKIFFSDAFFTRNFSPLTAENTPVKNYDDKNFASVSLLVPKSGTFPKNADDLLPNLPRNNKGQIITSDKVRIRPEQHPLKSGETYSPRHHGQHYHVEIRKDVNKSWNNKDNIIKIKPENYNHGEGTGFLPGEQFP